MLPLRSIALDGETLSTAALLQCAQQNTTIELSPDARERVSEGRAIVERALASGEVVYGVNTGFGVFSNVTISHDKLCELQANLIRSHSSGVGEPLSSEQTRMLLALRINVLAKGHSGISLHVLEQMVAAFNRGCIPVVPSKGTVGASGDLAPLSHLALGLMGEGEMWDPSTGRIAHAHHVLARAELQPIRLGAKEGLAMINGTQMIAALGAEAVERAARVARLADYVAALTLEVLRGTVRAFDPLIHRARPHRGQAEVAGRVRAVLQPDEPSELFLSHRYEGKVQDAYSLRCVPQVHGIAHDTIEFARGVLDVELNSATDNPMCFTQAQIDAAEPWIAESPVCYRSGAAHAGQQPCASNGVAALDPAVGHGEEPTSLEDARREIAALRIALASERQAVRAPTGESWSLYKKSSDTHRGVVGGGLILSGGNFHGEYPAKVLDFLGIAVAELGCISERRIERLCNPSLSGLPAFLVAEGGLNSGFMIAHCTAAALVAENRVLAHPASVDSISTSAAKEDHVSMGGFAARKALDIVEHVETVVAIELLAACQALDHHRPLMTTPALEALHTLVRTHVPVWDKDRYMAPDIQAALRLVQRGEALETIEEAIVLHARESHTRTRHTQCHVRPK